MSSAAPQDSQEVLARVQDALNLVAIHARQMAKSLGGGVTPEELMSYGREALLLAARRFDPTLGVPFRRWANLRIRGGILDGVRAQAHLPRGLYRRVMALESAHLVREAGMESETVPCATPEAADARVGAELEAMAMAMALSMYGSGAEVETAPDDSPTPEEQAARGEVAASLRAAVQALPEAERRLIERHYFEGATLDQAAREQGLSKSWASRLHSRAVQSMAVRLRDEPR